MKIKAIITGATGMVGEGVLQECLIHPDFKKIATEIRKFESNSVNFQK